MTATAKICNGNIKTGKSIGTFSKLYSNELIETPCGLIQGTCGDFCKGCSKDCYVKKSYRYDSVKKRHALNTIAFREDLEKAFEDIRKQCERKRKKFEIIRINQSGELETAAELHKWIDEAEHFKNTEYYIYTKNYKAVFDVVKSGRHVPKNFTCLISIWHEYGLNEYRLLSHLPWVKAFVYMDGYKYPEWLVIETMCTAYGIDGKMNHDITCDKCKKCTALRKCKVIGCYNH